MLTINIVGIIIGGTFAALIVIPTMLAFAWLYEPIIFVNVAHWFLRTVFCWPCWLLKRRKRTLVSADDAQDEKHGRMNVGKVNRKAGVALVAEDQETADAIRKHADTNQDGVLSTQELRNFAAVADRNADGVVTKDEVEQTVSVADLDRDGIISQPEMNTLLSVADSNDDGMISKAELQTFSEMTSMAVNDDGMVTSAELAAVAEIADADGNGVVNAEEGASVVELLKSQQVEPEHGLQDALAHSSPPPSPPELVVKLQASWRKTLVVRHWQRNTLEREAAQKLQGLYRRRRALHLWSHALQQRKEEKASTRMQRSWRNHLVREDEGHRSHSQHPLSPPPSPPEASYPASLGRSFSYESLNEVALKAFLTHAWRRKDWPAVRKILFGWVTNVTLYFLMILVFFLYGCQLFEADGRGESEALAGRTDELIFAWALSAFQRFVLHEPTLILAEKGLPMLFASAFCANCCGETIVNLLSLCFTGLLNCLAEIKG